MRAQSLLAAIFLVFAIGCGSPDKTAKTEDAHGHGEEAGHSEKEVSLDAEQQKLAGIQVATAELSQNQKSIEAPGVVQATTQGRAMVTPSVAGKLVSINVQLGAKVRRGDVIGVLESPELATSWSMIAEAQRGSDAAAAGVKDAKASYDLAKSRVQTAKTNFERQKQFVAAGAYNQAPVQQAQNELNEAQSELLSVQKEQAAHAEQFRRQENLYRDGLISKSDLESAKLELQQDEIRLSRTKAKIDNAKLTYDREKNIAQKGLVNARELQTAEAEVRSATLESERSRIALGSVESALKNASRAVQNAASSYQTLAGTSGASKGTTSVVAPIDGTITALHVTRGQAIDRTQSICEIDNLAAVWVTANIQEKDLNQVKVGSPVRVRLTAQPGEGFTGVIQVVGSRLDAKTRSVPVQCIIQNARGRLKPDMFATVYLGVGAPTSAISVPSEALVEEDEGAFVFVKNGDKFEKRSVVVTTRNDKQVTLASGLRVGEQYAVKGAFVLSSEQKKDELKGHED